MSSYFLETSSDDGVEETLTMSAIHDDEGGNTLFGNASTTARRQTQVAQIGKFR